MPAPTFSSASKPQKSHQNVENSTHSHAGCGLLDFGSRCAGIDVGKKFLLVCVSTGPANETPTAEVRKFGTLRPDLESLRKWLQAEGCTHAVMESTGVYWKPALNVLEDDPAYSLKIVLANPQQVKAVTGHKNRSARREMAGPPPAARA